MTNFDEKDLLTRELRERSGDVGGHPIDFASVRHSARRIRRRRAAVTGAVAALVAAAALPAGLAITSSIDPAYGPAEQPSVAPTPAPKPAPAPAPTPRPDGTFPLALEGLPRGADPKVSYVLAREKVLVTPQQTFDLPAAYSQVTPYREGWLATLGGENGWENVVLDAGMDVERTTLGGAALVPSADGTRVLHSQRDFEEPGRTVVVDEPSVADHERQALTWEAPRNSTVVPVGYLGEQRVVFQTEGGEDPAITLATYDGGPTTVPLQGFLRLTSASEAAGLVAGLVSYDPTEGGCYGVMDPAVSTTETLWETCDYSLYEFSPDGRHVIAGTTYFDMWGPSQLAVLDVATGEPVVEFTPERRDTVVQVAQATWEDEDTVAAIVVEGDEMGMVRAELTGALEAVTDTFTAQDMSLRLWFADSPRS
ncbi:MAG: hypothetical protein ACRDPR_19285 [Nocardioidaceae bacterium]